MLNAEAFSGYMICPETCVSGHLPVPQKTGAIFRSTGASGQAGARQNVNQLNTAFFRKIDLLPWDSDAAGI